VHETATLEVELQDGARCLAVVRVRVLLDEGLREFVRVRAQMVVEHVHDLEAVAAFVAWLQQGVSMGSDVGGDSL